MGCEFALPTLVVQDQGGNRELTLAHAATPWSAVMVIQRRHDSVNYQNRITYRGCTCVPAA